MRDPLFVVFFYVYKFLYNIQPLKPLFVRDFMHSH